VVHKTIIIGMLALVLSACAGKSQPAAQITVTMDDFFYGPSAITIPAGQPVELTIKNDGQIEHDFVVDDIDVSSVSTEGSGVGDHHMSGDHADYDLHVSTSAGGTSILKFTAKEPGTYKIFCSIAGHIEAGMIGELIVVSE
jgi:uncharacterized cupredoxin-like copper-binding protein